MTPGVPVPVDRDNPLLAQVATRLDTGRLMMNGLMIAVLTIRGPMSTTTVFLSKEDLERWVDMMSSLARSMSVAGLVVPSAAETTALMNGAAG
jgi:hypothetical protein